jgi:hypothetical protein
VSTIAAILDHRRVLGLLRFMGMPVSTVRRVILAEAALPARHRLRLCTGLGFLVAWCVVAGLIEGRRTVSWPYPVLPPGPSRESSARHGRRGRYLPQRAQEHRHRGDAV